MKGTDKMSEVILETRNLTKKYRNQYALKDVSISIKKNHIYGFIGENGAGKSTLMKIVSGLIFPTSGDMTLMGETDPAAMEKKRKLVRTMIEGPYIYPGYTGRFVLPTRLFIHSSYSANRFIITSQIRYSVS